MNTDLYGPIRQHCRSYSGSMWPRDEIHVTAGEVLDVGGRRVDDVLAPGNPPRHWLVLGVQSQMHFWARTREVSKWIAREFLTFQDLDLWWKMEPFLLDEFCDFLPANGNEVAFLWVTPIMWLIGQRMARRGQRIVNIVTDSHEIPDNKSIRFDGITTTGRKSTLRPHFFTEPSACDDPTSVHVLLRKRYRVEKGAESGELFSVEPFVCRLHPHLHADDHLNGASPAVRPHYHRLADAPAGTGWIETPHVTMVQVDLQDGCVWARYLALRFEPDVPTISTFIKEATQPFDSFVGHHPDLLRLFRSLIPGARIAET